MAESTYSHYTLSVGSDSKTENDLVWSSMESFATSLGMRSSTSVGSDFHVVELPLGYSKSPNESVRSLPGAEKETVAAVQHE
jgi:hypothetical protein